MSAASDSSGNGVGYKRPPTDKQFQKGQSGNPKGRSRGKKSLQQFLEQELNSMVEITIDGQRRKLPKAQVIAMKLVRDAMKGEIKALTLIQRHCPRVFDDVRVEDAHDSIADQQAVAVYLAGLDKGQGDV